MAFYNIVQPEASLEILRKKMENIRMTGAEIVITGNPGCLAQIKYGAEVFKVPVKVVHPITLLRQSYDNEIKD